MKGTATLREPGTPTRGPAPGEDEKDLALASLAKALGHPARVAILRLLLRRTSCVCGEIVDELPLAQSTVSQHLKSLKEAGLIRGEVDRPRICYCVDPAGLDMLRELLDDLVGAVPSGAPLGCETESENDA